MHRLVKLLNKWEIDMLSPYLNPVPWKIKCSVTEAEKKRKEKKYDNAMIEKRDHYSYSLHQYKKYICVEIQTGPRITTC